MRQFICALNVRSVKRDAARTRKKSANSNLVHNLRSEFDPHHHLRGKASVRQYNSAWMISPLPNLRAEQVLLIYNTRISTNKRMICGSDLAEWLERLTANAVVNTVESEGRQVKQFE